MCRFRTGEKQFVHLLLAASCLLRPLRRHSAKWIVATEPFPEQTTEIDRRDTDDGTDPLFRQCGVEDISVLMPTPDPDHSHPCRKLIRRFCMRAVIFSLILC